MLWLILGLLLWTGAHVFKRLAPEQRASLGDKGRGIAAIAIVVSVVLMVIGYRAADGAVLWGRHPATVGINNLLMLVAVYFFASSGAKNVMGQRMRHPQLIAFKTWAIAHLLVNGDVPSLILFGGLLAWAVFEVIIINKQTEWTKPVAVVDKRKEIVAIVATVIVFVIAVAIHYALGYPAFG